MVVLFVILLYGLMEQLSGKFYFTYYKNFVNIFVNLGFIHRLYVLNRRYIRDI